MPQPLRGARPHDSRPPALLSDFYREEFLKHQQCLHDQREYYSERAICDAEQALARIMAQIDQLCTQKDAEQLIGRLLRQFDVLTGLSAWSDRKNAH
jgi:hypothetical protein